MKPKLHPQERRWYESSEYPVTWVTILSFFYAAFRGKVLRHFPLQIAPEIFLASLYAVATAYLWGRVLWKKNRGHFYSGWRTSEFHMWTLKFSTSWGLYLLAGLRVEWFLGSLVVAAVNYCLGRGIIKGMGVRTQMMVMR